MSKSTNSNILKKINIKNQDKILFYSLRINLTKKQPNIQTILSMIEASKISYDPSINGYTNLKELFAELND